MGVRVHDVRCHATPVKSLAPRASAALKERAKQVAFVRFSAPDLDKMEAFLVHFGMKRSARTVACPLAASAVSIDSMPACIACQETALYMRGTGRSHHIHVTHLGSLE